MRDELLGETRHVGVVGEGFVELEHRELGIVAGRHTFVAEHPSDLEHAIETADDQPLQIELGGNSQGELHVERVVVSDERTRGRTAGDRVQHRCLHLDVTTVLEKPAQRGDDAKANVEHAPGFVVGDEVDVALPVARVDIGEAVPLVGQLARGAGQHLERLHPDRELTLLGLHHRAARTHPVAAADVITEPRELAVTEVGLAHEQLELTGPVAQRDEDQLSLPAHEHRSTRDTCEFVGRLARLDPGIPLVAHGREGVAALEAIRVLLRVGGLGHWFRSKMMRSPYNVSHGS